MEAAWQTRQNSTYINNQTSLTRDVEVLALLGKVHQVNLLLGNPSLVSLVALLHVRMHLEHPLLLLRHTHLHLSRRHRRHRVPRLLYRPHLLSRLSYLVQLKLRTLPEIELDICTCFRQLRRHQRLRLPSNLNNPW